MADRIVNALGDQCPVPVIKATKALSKMTEPGTLEVQVDNEIAVQNLLRLAAGKNCKAAAEKKGEGLYAVMITVDSPLGGERTGEAGIKYNASGTGPDSERDSEQNTGSGIAEGIGCIPDRRGQTVVAIGSACMGQGDEELGKTLMKGFIYALSQLEELPECILFYNGGASIPVEDSISLEDLRSMEAQGVKILTCGTCLNYYGLTDKLAVGTVTNMYTIAETLSAADKVIKP